MICVGASRSFVVVEPHTTLSTSVPGIFFTNFAPALGASFLLVADTVSSNSVWQYRRNPTTNLRPRLRVTELQKANRNFSPEVQVGQRGLLNSTVCSPGSDYCDIEGVDEQWPVPSDHSRIWSQPGKAVPGSHLPTGHIGQLNRAQSKASAGPMYSKFRTPSPSEHSHVVPKHQLRRYPPPKKKKNCLIK